MFLERGSIIHFWVIDIYALKGTRINGTIVAENYQTPFRLEQKVVCLQADMDKTFEGKFRGQAWVKF